MVFEDIMRVGEVHRSRLNLGGGGVGGRGSMEDVAQTLTRTGVRPFRTLAHRRPPDFVPPDAESDDRHGSSTRTCSRCRRRAA